MADPDQYRRVCQLMISIVLLFFGQKARSQFNVHISSEATTVCGEDDFTLVCWYPLATSGIYHVSAPAWFKNDVKLDFSMNVDHVDEKINNTAHRLSVSSSARPNVNSVTNYACELIRTGPPLTTDRSDSLSIKYRVRLTSPQRYESTSLSSTEATLFLEQFKENDCFRTHQVHLNITWRNSTPNSQVYSMVSDTLDASTSNKVQITLTGLTSSTQYTIQVRTESLSDRTIASTYSTFTITTTTPSVIDPPDFIGLQVHLIALIAVSIVALVAVVLAVILLLVLCIRKCCICKTRYTIKRRMTKDVIKVSEEMKMDSISSNRTPDYADVFWKGNTPTHTSTPKNKQIHTKTNTAVVEYAASAFSLHLEPGTTAMTESLFKRTITEAFDQAGVMLFSVQGVCFRRTCVTEGTCACMSVQAFHPDIHGSYLGVTFVASCKLNNDNDPLVEEDVWDVTLAKGGLDTPKGFVIAANDQISNHLFQIVEASGIHFVACTGGCHVDGWAEQITTEFKSMF